MQTKLFRLGSSGLVLLFFILAWTAHTPLGNLLILYTLLITSCCCIWFPWKSIGKWCIHLSLQESHSLWKSVANSLKRQDAYFQVSGACMQCSSFIYEGAHFCTQCGLATSLVYDGKWCMRCSSINPSESRFCACCCYEFPQTESNPITPPLFQSALLMVRTGKHAAIRSMEL